MTVKRSIENPYSLWNPDSNGYLPVSATLVPEEFTKAFQVHKVTFPTVLPTVDIRFVRRLPWRIMTSLSTKNG
jgi:hypothetical protein